MKVSRYAAAIAPSATLAAAAQARELKARGVAVLDFAVGEPDFDTPAHIRAAAKAAMDAGHTRYTAASGIPELKKAIADDLRTRLGADYQPAEICVSNGAKHAIFTALCATLEPGDEVVIPTPYWVSYRDLVEMTGAKAVLVPCGPETRFKLDAARLSAALTPRTKMLMLNSPGNPTGMAYSRRELLALAEVVVARNLICLSDEIYERLLYVDEPFQCFAALGPEVKARTLTVNGVSKTYAMTGWRIGWTAAPAAIAKAMDTVQSQQTSNPCSVSQHAALAALVGPQDGVETMRREFARRRDFVCARLNHMSGLSVLPPDGAFYAFFDIRKTFGKTFGDVLVKDSASFCAAALGQAHVNLVAGSAFGAEGFARMSFAASMSQLETGLDRLGAWLATAK